MNMLKDKIGIDAGRIWYFLDSNGDSEIEEIKLQLKLDNDDFYLALGWLAHENKVSFYENEAKFYVFLN